MWLSNTATTLMLVPVALAILQTYPDRRLAVPLLLAICYGASTGGLGTPLGSPPNLVFMQVYAQTTGTSLVMVTHHPAQAERMSLVLRIHEGTLQ